MYAIGDWRQTASKLLSSQATMLYVQFVVSCWLPLLIYSFRSNKVGVTKTGLITITTDLGKISRFLSLNQQSYSQRTWARAADGD